MDFFLKENGAFFHVGSKPGASSYSWHHDNTTIFVFLDNDSENTELLTHVIEHKMTNKKLGEKLIGQLERRRKNRAVFTLIQDKNFDAALDIYKSESNQQLQIY